MQNLRFIVSLVCIVSFGAAMAAKKNDSASAVELILAIGSKPGKPEAQIMAELKELLKEIDVNAQEAEGFTALMHAVYERFPAVVDYLIANGADTEKKNRFGQTALLIASFISDNVIGSYLIEHGANINAVDNHGQTALIITSKGGASEPKRLLQKLLLEKGADPDIQDNEGKTALMWAAVEKDLGYIKAIVEVGCADLDITDKNGKTALVIAQEAGNVAAAEYLEKMGNDLAHKQKVAERKKRKQEKKEADLLLAARKEQELLKNFTEALRALV